MQLQLQALEKLLQQKCAFMDVAFRPFDVGSSYHRDADAPKCRSVHPKLNRERELGIDRGCKVWEAPQTVFF